MQGSGVQSLGLDFKLDSGLIQKNLGQGGNVLPALAQRWEFNTDHVEPMEKILAKAPFLNPLGKILIGGRNHPHVSSQFLVTPHPEEGAV